MVRGQHHLKAQRFVEGPRAAIGFVVDAGVEGLDEQVLRPLPAKLPFDSTNQRPSNAVTMMVGLDAQPMDLGTDCVVTLEKQQAAWPTGHPRDVAVAAGLPTVIPVLRFPDGRLMNDSTPLAHAL